MARGDECMRVKQVFFKYNKNWEEKSKFNDITMT